jgi:hypothetical protein
MQCGKDAPRANAEMTKQAAENVARDVMRNASTGEIQ